VQLAQQLRLSPEQFELVCEANPNAVLELSADGHLINMTPTGSETSARKSTLVVLLGLDLKASGLPFKLLDSSGGLRLPDRSGLNKNVSLVHLEPW
jgi:Uma2 family endonuclease